MIKQSQAHRNSTLQYKIQQSVVKAVILFATFSCRFGKIYHKKWENKY